VTSEAKVVLVTGGTRGIGAAIATAFLAAGDTVAVCGRSEPEAPPRSGDREAEFLAADVRDPDGAAAVVDSVLRRHGRLDVLVNNAGGTAAGPAGEMSSRSAAAVVDLNLMAPFYVSQRANAAMQGQPDGGAIVNVGSVAALRPAAGTAIYAAAKAGLEVLTRALALEWGPKVRVNLVTPGLVETEGSARHYGGDAGLEAVRAVIPAGRMARPDDIAAACLALASPQLGFVSGAELRVDGGGESPGWLVALKNATE
jgi:NAD(P)-dependent dehydrogenase (short-subunit alcohol dehydrogenase family)